MATLLITFRESLEAALIVGILLAFLKKNDLSSFKKQIWIGVIFGIVLSIIVGIIFVVAGNAFEETAEKLFEGIVSLIGAFLISTLILWLNKNKSLKTHLEGKLNNLIISRNFGKVLLFVTLLNILREGFETVIFLYSIPGENYSFFFTGILGIVIAIILAYLLFKGFVKLKLSNLFKITNFLLILFAGGLVAYGIHELQEANVIPTIIEHVYDINWLINEKGTLGSILKGLLGYNGNPSLIEIIAYWTYIIPSLFLLFLKKEY
ncbi:MAG: FTR1 family protein [Thermosipho sp. (in: Bacteria)]|nr:FTR1 family protein [Thermosipho sp. (in: thermotogales)]